MHGLVQVGSTLVIDDALDDGFFGGFGWRSGSVLISVWFRLALAHRQIGFVSHPVAKYNVGNTDSLTGRAAYGVDESWILSIERYLKMAETLDPEDRQLVNQFVRFKSYRKLRNTIKYGNTTHARWLLGEYRRLNISGISRRYQLLALLPTTVIRSMQWLFLTARSFIKKR